MAIQSDHKDLRGLIMGDLTQFHIPIYQRSYTWDAKEQVGKLIDDILEFGDEYKDNRRSDYYIGNIIVKNQTRGFQTERVVIDGQQRITTTILILCAIRDVCLFKIKTEEAKEFARNISNSLYTEDGNKIKLKLNNMEHQSALSTILTGAIDTITVDDKKTKYWKNYKFIYNKLTSMEKGDFFNFTALLERVKVVIIFLDDDQDENSVFESINSFGKPLSGSDLIKNFIFTFKNYNCTHEQESHLTDLYTKNFESLFSNEDNVEEELEKFFREYIAIYTYTLVRKDPKAIYHGFKKLIGNIESYLECKEKISDLVKWGLIYQKIRVGNIESINHSYLEYLRASFGTYATLLMDVIDKHSRIEDGSIVIENSFNLNRILKKIVAYDASRFISGYQNKEITRFIPTIPVKLKKEDNEYYINYAKSFEDLVTSTPEGYQQPSLNILKRTIHSIDLYTRRRTPLLRLLILIENVGKKEILSFEYDIKKYQIEHIVPQTLNDKWSYISKEEHSQYLHTLGNLSVTLNNQNLSNKGFNEKKEILSTKSKINLNKELLIYEEFDVSAIKDRANRLLEIFSSEFEIDKIDYSNAVERHELTVFMNHKEIQARGLLVGSGLKVLSGSEAMVDNLDSLQESLVELKKELITSGTLKNMDTKLVFTKDMFFSSASQAAAIVSGYSINGKTSWKNKENISLSELNF